MSEDVTPYGAVNRPENPTPDELRQLIAQTGLSQRKAAEALDLDERTLRYYASGQQKIPRVVIYALRYLSSQAQSGQPWSARSVAEQADRLATFQTQVHRDIAPTNAAAVARRRDL